MDASLSEASQKLVEQLADLREQMRILAKTAMSDLIRMFKIKNKDKFTAEEKARSQQQDKLREMRAQEDRLKDLLEKEMLKGWITRDAECGFCSRVLTPSDDRFTCSGCRKVVYCDETCAEGDWHRHYRVCK